MILLVPIYIYISVEKIRGFQMQFDIFQSAVQEYVISLAHPLQNQIINRVTVHRVHRIIVVYLEKYTFNFYFYRLKDFSINSRA